MINNKWNVLILVCGFAFADQSLAQDEIESPYLHCVNFCDSVESDCSSNARTARMDCSRRAATLGRDQGTMRRAYEHFFCDYHRQDHCAGATDSERCRSRSRDSFADCSASFRSNTTVRYLDCNAGSRDAQRLCSSVLRDCKKTCKTDEQNEDQ